MKSSPISIEYTFGVLETRGLMRYPTSVENYKGVKLLEALPDIKEGVSTLPDIKTGIDALNMKFDVFTDEQRTFNQKMDAHNKRFDSYIEEQRVHNKLLGAHNLRLEQILQKLVEK